MITPLTILILLYLFVCLEFFVPLENFSLIWRRYHCRWRAANFDLCSALMVIDQWGFFNVPHLLWRGPSVYNGHLRPWIITPIAEQLVVELSLSVLTTLVCRGWVSNTQPPACSNPLRHRRGLSFRDVTPIVNLFKESYYDLFLPYMILTLFNKCYMAGKLTDST